MNIFATPTNIERQLVSRIFYLRANFSKVKPRFLKIIIYLSCAVVFLHPRYAHAQQEEAKVQSLLKAAADTIEVDADKGMQMADEGLKAAQKIGFKNGVATALYTKANAYESKDDINTAISYYDKGLNYCKENKLVLAGDGLASLGRLYSRTGATQKGLEYLYTCLQLRQLLKDSSGIAATFNLISQCFYDRLEFAKVNFYSTRALKIYERLHDPKGIAESLLNLGLVCLERKDYDRAFVYIRRSEAMRKEHNIYTAMAEARISADLGLYYDYKGNNDSALYYYQKALEIDRKHGYKRQMAIALNNIGQLLLLMNKLDEAESYLAEAYNVAREVSSFTDMYYSSTNMSILYGKKGNFENAYKCLIGVGFLKDSIINRERMKTVEELNTKYQTKEMADRNAMLQKENDLQNLRLRQDKIMMYGAGLGVLMLAVIAVLLLRQNKLLRSQQRIELAHKQLYAQMNPHFIFNCLSSIQHFILTNDNENANTYLTNFSSLMRQTLENSKSSTITLREELKYLQNYLVMEHLRFENKFTYTIEHEEGLATNTVELPPMMVQPFAENAIKHGLAHFKHNEGRLSIRFYKKEGALYCEVEDNGIGRKQSQHLKEKINPAYNSQGMAVTMERMELVSKINRADQSITIIDKEEDGKATGTLVIIKFPIEI